MYYSYIEIEYVAMSFSPAITDLAVKLVNDFLSYQNTQAYIYSPCAPGLE
jgi:hypothetical protein